MVRVENTVTVPNRGFIHLFRRSSQVQGVVVETWLCLEGKQKLIRYDLSSNFPISI